VASRRRAVGAPAPAAREVTIVEGQTVMGVMIG